MEAWAAQPWMGTNPWGSPEAHLDREALETGWLALPGAPRGRGRVLGVVLRLEEQGRLTPPSAELCPERGVVGDRWALGKKNTGMQVAIMRADIAHLIANGQSGALFGNNLLVDLDLSEDHLQPGSRLQIGTAQCVVSSEPHRACRQFARRFGHAASRLTADKRWTSQHVRGLYLTVCSGGRVAPGDAIEVLR